MSADRLPACILWRRLDRPGHESARISFERGSWHLAGTAVFAHEQQACRLDYRIACDDAWRTRSATVAGWIGDRLVHVEVAVDPGRGWRLDGQPSPAVAGCTDIDLNFSPSTNLLPIRRLDLAVGQSAAVRAAWLRFPGLGLEPLDQVYRRTGEAIYRYESGDGAFVRDLTVDAAGFVTRYPGFFEVEG
jgi:hypothetical protein